MDLIELISRIIMDWMLSSIVYLHGIHSNGVGQGPNSDIQIIHSFIKYHI